MGDMSKIKLFYDSSLTKLNPFMVRIIVRFKKKNQKVRWKTDKLNTYLYL